jgi:hypothetical protein
MSKLETMLFHFTPLNAENANSARCQIVLIRLINRAARPICVERSVLLRARDKCPMVQLVSVLEGRIFSTIWELPPSLNIQVITLVIFLSCSRC